MKHLALPMLALISIPSFASACLWDYDTLKQERARFPDALEIITGKFLRHSKEFYEWRIQDRLKKIAAEPKNPALYDDLAVAYEKTGQNAKAIETMLKVETFAPGRYETYSNLGTFYFLGGDLKKGLEYVDKALAINPDAHFGREKYQKYLTEYVIERSKDGKIVLPLSSVDEHYPGSPGSFSRFLAMKLSSSSDVRLSKEDYQSAVKGVLGMMRFAYHESPILLEVLGDILSGYSGYSPELDAKRLAARAYLQASYQVKDPAEKQSYRELAKRILSLQTKNENTQEALPLEDLEVDFRRELDDAARWYSELQQREVGWLRDGLNPEEEFDKLYTQEPRVPGEIAPDDTYLGRKEPDWRIQFLAVVGLIGALVLCPFITLFVWRKLFGPPRSEQAIGNP